MAFLGPGFLVLGRFLLLRSCDCFFFFFFSIIRALCFVFFLYGTRRYEAKLLYRWETWLYEWGKEVGCSQPLSLRCRGIYFLHCFMYTTEHGHSILAYCHIHESLLYTFCLYCV
jgi:hypothetical protein